MRILIDGDAFPNVKEIIELGKQYQKEVIIYIDTSHYIESDYAKIVVASVGANAADLLLENEIKENDLVLTQDYGVAIIALSKKAYCLNQLGNFYTNENIDYLMEMKNINRKVRKHTNVKGPKKRTKKDEEKLLQNIQLLINRSDNNE